MIERGKEKRKEMEKQKLAELNGGPYEDEVEEDTESGTTPGGTVKNVDGENQNHGGQDGQLADQEKRNDNYV